MKINSLQIRNFLGIRELQLTPDGKFQFIQGRNGSGKTSILEAISYAFSGRKKGMKIKEYINKDADDSTIYIDLDGLSISRVLEDGKEKVSAVRGDGSNIVDAKRFLKNFVQGLSFNPIEFAFAPRDEQKNLVLKALKIEYTHEDAQNDMVIPNGYDLKELDGITLISSIEDGLMANIRDTKKEKELTESYILKLRENLPDESDLVTSHQIKSIDEKISKYHKAVRDIEAEVSESKEKFNEFKQKQVNEVAARVLNMEQLQSNADKIRGIDLSIFPVQKDKDAVFEAIKNSTEFIKERKKDLGVEIDRINSEVESEAEKLQIANKEKKIRIENGTTEVEKLTDQKTELMKRFETQTSPKEIEAKEKELFEIMKKLDLCEKKLERLRKEVKPRLVNNSNLKVEGLTFDNRDFYVNGVILHNLSDAEKLRIAVKIAQSISNHIRFILLDGVERVDPESMKEFLDELKDSDFQYFFTTCQPVVENSGQTLNL